MGREPFCAGVSSFLRYFEVTGGKKEGTKRGKRWERWSSERGTHPPIPDQHLARMARCENVRVLPVPLDLRAARCKVLS